MSGFILPNHLLRSVFQNKKLTWINIIGLSLGLAVSVFLLVYLEFEYSYDKHFKDADRIYRMLSVLEENTTQTYPICLEKLAFRLSHEVPEVEMASRLFRNGIGLIAKENGEKMRVTAHLVDSTFLRIFQFKPVYGQVANALDRAGNCVITRTTSERIFGEGINPVGKTLIADDHLVLEVAAVMEDVPDNTHFQVHLLARLPEYHFDGLEYMTYLKFRSGIDIPEAIKKCNILHKKILDERFGDYSNIRFYSITEPLTAIHTSTQADFDLSVKTNKTNLIFIILVALFILGVAVSNFIALYIVQGEKRALEISIRKTNGASRTRIIYMLFGETFLITLLAFLLALGLYYSFADRFAMLLNFNLPDKIGITGKMWLEFWILFLVVAGIAGGYPAYYLSRFSPIDLIRKSVVRKYKLTAASVIVQFSIVIFCISALLVVWRQLNYIKKLPLGFQTENILEERSVFIWASNYEALSSELLQSPFILKVGLGQGNPIDGGSGESIRRIDQSGQEVMKVEHRRIGPGYFDVFQIPLLAGRYFTGNSQIEKQNIILTESVVSMLGLKEPIGQKVYCWGDNPFTVIGVVKDVIPSAYSGPEKWIYSSADGGALAVKFMPGKDKEAKAALLEFLHKRYGNIPLSPVLTADVVRQKYSQDEITFRILTSGTIIAILLASLGILALSGFVVRQKRKEISVRRVMGAQVDEMVYNLNRYILIRTLPAVPVGVILGYCVMNRWLGNFEYAVTLSWWLFALALILTFVIIAVAVFYQILKAVMANPVKALKSE